MRRSAGRVGVVVLVALLGGAGLATAAASGTEDPVRPGTSTPLAPTPGPVEPLPPRDLQHPPVPGHQTPLRPAPDAVDPAERPREDEMPRARPETPGPLPMPESSVSPPPALPMPLTEGERKAPGLCGVEPPPGPVQCGLPHDLTAR